MIRSTLAEILVLLVLVSLLAGCRAVQTAADVPGQAVRAVTTGQSEKPKADPVEVQQALLRFADRLTLRMNGSIDRLQRGTNALARTETLQLKLAVISETCSIASGPNPVANLLDMTYFVTVMRLALEEHWQPVIFGESGLPMLEGCRSAESEVWELAGKLLTSEQQTELREAIIAWHRENPLPENVLAPRAVGFAPQLAQKSEARTPRVGSVFELLGVDPLSGLDPAVREIAQTRLFAERALFVTQKMPMLLSWQTELLSINMLDQPTVQQLLTNTTQLSTSVERFARVAEQLPQQLEAQEAQLTPLITEFRQALIAGTETITTFDALMQRLGVGETNNAAPPETNTTPFRILDYAETAAQMDATARQLTELLVMFDRTLGSTNLTQLAAQVGPAVEQAQAGGREVVDYAFWKGVLLVAIAFVAALIYRAVGRKCKP